MSGSRQAWRRQKAEDDRQNRAIIELIMRKYPRIYFESLNAYNVLKQKYPNKQDIRKLPEFRQMCCGQATDLSMVQTETESNNPKNVEEPNNPKNVEEPNNPKSVKEPNNPKSVKESNNPKNHFQDNMVLNIDLMKNPLTSEDLTIPQDHELELLDPSVVDRIIEELQHDSNINNFCDDMEIDNMFEDMEIDNMSPLEAELLLL